MDLDSASTEALHPAARETLLAALDQGYADPLRLHRRGREARLLLDNAREVLATLLGVRTDEVSFTSSGTTAVHLGVLGLLLGRRRVSERLVHTAVEHSAVMAAGAWWERHLGGTTTSVPVDPHGRVRLDALAEALREPAGVAAVQVANPEVGTLQPLAEAAALAAERGRAPLRRRCRGGGAGRACPTAGRPRRHRPTSGAGRRAWGCCSSARAPDGGRPSPPTTAPTRGSPASRTSRRRSPPQPRCGRWSPSVTRWRPASARSWTGSAPRSRSSPTSTWSVDPVERLPHVVTFSCLYVEGEALVTELDRRGFAVSSGSACTASSLEPSHVLAAMGALTHGNVRVSLARDTTEADVERLLAVLPGVVASLRP